MIAREDIQIGDVVRLKSGSPKFIVNEITEPQPGEFAVELFGWSDRQGFVSYFVPLGFLCWPRPAPEAEI